MDYGRVLIFGAHPDDEIAMGGTIALMARKGVKVVVVTMTDGSEGYPRPEMEGKVAEMRRKEAEECDKVLGISRRIMLGRPDMGLVNDKDTLVECVKVIREVRPEAIFTHGPDGRHRDHLRTHDITVEAAWHAGEPVLAILGPPWKTPHLYYYKEVLHRPLPTTEIDVSQTHDKKLEAYATQVSQHFIFGRSKEEFLREAERVRKERPKVTERFWIAEWTALKGFLPKDL